MQPRALLREKASPFRMGAGRSWNWSPVTHRIAPVGQRTVARGSPRVSAAFWSMIGRLLFILMTPGAASWAQRPQPSQATLQSSRAASADSGVLHCTNRG